MRSFIFPNPVIYVMIQESVNYKKHNSQEANVIRFKKICAGLMLASLAHRMERRRDTMDKRLKLAMFGGVAGILLILIL